MGSKRNDDYDEGEYSDDFEPYEEVDQAGYDSDDIRVYRSTQGPKITVKPFEAPLSTQQSERETEPEQVNRFITKNKNRGSSRSGIKKKTQDIPKYERSSNKASDKNRQAHHDQALMVATRQQDDDESDDEESPGTTNDGNSEPSPRNQNQRHPNLNKYHNHSQQKISRKPLNDSQVKKLARAHVAESYQSMTLRIGGFRKTYGSNTSTNFGKNNHGKIQPYTPLPHPPPMRLGFAKPFGTVSQRLLSAKRMTINDLKNKIQELQIEMNDLRKENSALKHVEHRHKMALRKWEGREAELPRLMEQHKEELKNAETHVKKLNQQCRELEIKLKQRDKKMNSMEQELQKLRHLCSEAELEERQNLQTELDIVSANLCGAEKRLIQNKRHMEILEKNHQHQIQVEKQKLITANNRAMELQYEIMSLKQALRDKDRVLNYVQMKGSGRKLIRSFHEDERKSSNAHPSKYSVRKHQSDTTTGNTQYDPSSFSKLGSWT